MWNKHLEKIFLKLFKKVAKINPKSYFKAMVDDILKMPLDFDASLLTNGKDGSNKSKISKTRNEEKVKDHRPFYLRSDY